MDELEDLPKEIAQALGLLDARAERRAAHVDAERVSAGVLRRLREEPEAASLSVLGRRFGLGGMVRVAAGLAILVVAGVVGARLLHEREAPSHTGWLPVVDAHAARALTTAGADSLIRAVDHIQVLNGSAPSTSASVEELNGQELRALLQAMQTSEEGTE